MKFEVTGKNGSLTKFTIMGDQDRATEIVKSITTYLTREIDGGIRGEGSRADISRIREAVESVATSSEPAKPVKSAGNKPRRIESLEVAQRSSLSHGNAWVCSAHDVDVKGVSPELEGELICYVYA